MGTLDITVAIASVVLSLGSLFLARKVRDYKRQLIEQKKGDIERLRLAFKDVESMDDVYGRRQEFARLLSDLNVPSVTLSLATGGTLRLRLEDGSLGVAPG